MTRIIGGSAGGRRLRTPSGKATRPTSDRVREALFSALESTLGSLAGLGFLDLYAGSGAVGLEARSRGAGRVTLVERDRRTAGLVRENARSLGFADVEVVTGSALQVIGQPPGTPYDVVFCDPPYALAERDLGAVLAALAGHGWLAAAALVVVERSTRVPEPSWPAGIEPQRRRDYGETALWYGRAT